MPRWSSHRAWTRVLRRAGGAGGAASAAAHRPLRSSPAAADRGRDRGPRSRRGHEGRQPIPRAVLARARSFRFQHDRPHVSHLVGRGRLLRRELRACSPRSRPRTTARTLAALARHGSHRTRARQARDRVPQSPGQLSGPAATMAWSDEPFTGGGYAAYKPNQLAPFFAPLRAGTDRMHFAGEHLEALAGYMESAVRSGSSRRGQDRSPLDAPWRDRCAGDIERRAQDAAAKLLVLGVAASRDVEVASLEAQTGREGRGRLERPVDVAVGREPGDATAHRARPRARRSRRGPCRRGARVPTGRSPAECPARRRTR